MIEIKDKSKCCGCEACVNICPKKCIHMEEDKEGFRYPIVDKEKCIDCKLCEKVCPIIKEPEKQVLEELEYYAAYNKNDEILKDSSSGGIFSLLAKTIIDKDGIVYGVKQSNTYDIKFARIDNENDLNQLRGSKYLQAKINDIYISVKKDLQNNKYVLFSGTPCQIAALYKVLGKEYDKLYTVDVVCHGVPSDRVYREYIEDLEKKNKSKVVNIRWRDKVKGWGPNRITVFFENGNKKTTSSSENPFQTGFLNNIYLRNSCYKCIYARLPRISDVSLADFWGYEGELKKENENKGLSAIIVSTQKGKEIFDTIQKDIRYHSVTKEYLMSKSRHVYIHPKENNKREQFFKDLETMSFDKICIKYGMKQNVLTKCLLKTKNRIKKLKNIIVKGK